MIGQTALKNVEANLHGSEIALLSGQRRKTKGSVAAIIKQYPRFNNDEVKSLDGNRPAPLHNGAVSTDLETLQDTIMTGTS